ncbi:MAG TPA: ABC transporter substrate binding protein, partial [Candidatus Sulfobium mesophilum]|nr:ABC transporter substrate binding protein [Candidatus Sulfobium mesophilum]
MTHNMIGNIYKASFALLLIFISLSILSCRRQPVEKEYVIGVINLNPTMSSMVEGFKEGLAGKGYVEGKNVTYMQLKDPEDLDRVLGDLKVRRADLILAVTTPAMEKAQNAVRGTGIPIVGISFDPVRGGIVDSMVYKKENTTGIRVGGVVKKALEWLLLIVPHTKRVFVPVKFDTSAAESSLADLKDVATILNVDLLISNIEGRDDLRTALSSIPKDIDAVFIPHSLLIVSNLDTILETAVK